MLQGWLLPIPDPQAWDPDVGLRTPTPMGEPSVIQLLSILWAAHMAGIGLIVLHNHLSYHLSVASSLSSGAVDIF